MNVWMPVFHENMRFSYRNLAVNYQSKFGLHWSHYVVWSAGYWHVRPYMDRLNAEQRKVYT